jgi:DNA uptake protein ComE-like DNA-binding protein
MKCAHLRSIFLATATLLAVSAFIACNKSTESPDEIRRRTAEATETVRQDTKAVVDGVKEGMGKDKRAVNINKASREDLLSLPGITDRDADRIVADRPFNDTHDLVTRRVLSQAEYDKIQDRVIADR